MQDENKGCRHDGGCRQRERAVHVWDFLDQQQTQHPGAGAVQKIRRNDVLVKRQTDASSEILFLGRQSHSRRRNQSPSRNEYWDVNCL